MIFIDASFGQKRANTIKDLAKTFKGNALLQRSFFRDEE